ncbi:MAG: hypothetical protein KF872_10940 [Chitinophagales bacterium]|nr:hypothetical protein [Chitinophagales bacterium]
MQQRFYSSASYFLLVAAAVWMLGWLALAATFTHPNAEDLSLSHPTFTVGRFQFVVHTLATYDGRFFLNLLHTFTPLAYGSYATYPYMALGSLALFIAAVYFIFDTLFYAKKSIKLLFSLLFTGIYFLVTPSILHQLYWMSSSMVYLWSWIFFLFCCGSLIRAMQVSSEQTNNWWEWLALLLLPASIGINEMMLPLNVCLLLYTLAYGYYNSKLGFAVFFAAIGTMFIAFFVVSPGITQRIFIESSRIENYSFTHKLSISLQHLSLYTVQFFLHPVILFSLALLACFKSAFTVKSRVFPYLPFRFIFFAISTLLLAWSMISTYYLPMGGAEHFPHRIFNSVAVLFMLLLAIGALENLPNIAISNTLKMLVCILWIGSIFLSENNNINLIRTEFSSGQLSTYSNAMKLRHTQLEAVRNTQARYKLAIIDTIPCYPTSISRSSDIKRNRNAPHWNTAYELFYDIDAIALKGDTVNVGQ